MTNENNTPLETTDFVSKTQLKSEAKALQEFGKELLQLSTAKLELLPLNDTTRRALQDYHKQSGNIAKRRHLAYIGKCLRSDNADAIKLALQDDSFQQYRQQAQDNASSVAKLVESLIENGDLAIEKVLNEHERLDRQNLRQLVRNCKNAKNQQKLTNATNKLQTYLQMNGLN